MQSHRGRARRRSHDAVVERRRPEEMAQQSSGSWWTVVGAIVVLIAGHLALKYGIKPPIPSNLLYAYTIIIGITIYVYLASNTARWESFSRPLSRLFARQGNPPRPRRHFRPATAQCGLAGVCMGRRLAPVARRVAHHSPHAPWANHRAGQELQPHRPGKSFAQEPDKLAQYADEGRSIFRIASLAMATISMAPDISPTDSFHPQRTSSTSAPLPNCRSHTSSGASPRAALACHRNRIRGIQPCRFGRISSRKNRSGRSSCTSMLGLDSRRAPGKDTEP